MKIPKSPNSHEFTIKRSRFIGKAQRVDSREMAESLIAELWEEHPGASHIVYAFIVGDEKNELLGMSDNGEPHGTAGRPVMEVLKGSGIRDCLITVIRYFGGTKLGTGGLVHAYGDAAKGCLGKLSVEEKRDLVPVVFGCSYEMYDAVRIVLEHAQAKVVTEEFGTEVRIECAIEQGSKRQLQERLHDVSRGTIDLILE